MAYDADSGEVTSYVGRETAPALATPALLDDADGNPLPRSEAMLTGRATGVPGAVAVFADAQRDHGALRWDQLSHDTIARSEQGYPLTLRMAQHTHGQLPYGPAPHDRPLVSSPHPPTLEVRAPTPPHT